jgi:hypothetical protein
VGAANRDKNEGQGKNATQRPRPHVYFHDFFLRRFQIQKIPDWLLGVKRCFDYKKKSQSCMTALFRF